MDLDLIAVGPGVGITLRSFSTSHRLTVSGDINLGARNLTLEGEGDYILSGRISGSGGIRKLNTEELTLSGVVGNTYSGSTVVSSGLLRLSKALLLGFPDPIISSRIAIPGRLIIGSGSTGPLTDFVVHTYGNQIADSSEVEILGSGQLDLDGNSDQIGSLSMRGGKVLTHQGRDLGQLILGGNVEVALASTPSVIDGQLSLGPSGQRLFDIAQGATLRVDARIVGHADVSLVKSNRGNLFLTESNLFSGDVELLVGDDRIGSLTSNGGAVDTMNNTLILGGDILVNATNEVSRLSGHLSLGGVTRTIYTLGAANTPDLLITAEILDGGAPAGLNKVGEGST